MILKEAADAKGMPSSAKFRSARPLFPSIGARLDDSVSMTTGVQANNHFAKYMTFTPILLNIAIFYNNGYIQSIEPGCLFNKLKECLEDSKTASELVRKVLKHILSMRV